MSAVANRLGRNMPAHCTSTGKALLAMLTDDELHLLYPDERLIQLTPHSLGTRTELLDAVRTIRSRGFASSKEENEEGVASLAVALASTRSPRLAVNASLPLSRMSSATEQDILTRLVAAAEEIDHLLL
ncbi:IclR family transcriptional regulator domain-containing protein [Rhodococcus pyridinivorans]|nr:IclR family transcriptional regulator C-terminal domain-containing protein [Rhodococcus pyridinivorans]